MLVQKSRFYTLLVPAANRQHIAYSRESPRLCIEFLPTRLSLSHDDPLLKIYLMYSIRG